VCDGVVAERCAVRRAYGDLRPVVADVRSEVLDRVGVHRLGCLAAYMDMADSKTRWFARHAASCARPLEPWYAASAIAARMPITSTTNVISSIVKPSSCAVSFALRTPMLEVPPSRFACPSRA